MLPEPGGAGRRGGRRGARPILDWAASDASADARVASLLAVGLRRVGEFEATFRAALRLSLDRWAKKRAGTLGAEAPLRDRTGGHELDRLARASSLVSGIESFVVLKDISRLGQDEAEDTIGWVARTVIAGTLIAAPSSASDAAARG